MTAYNFEALWPTESCNTSLESLTLQKQVVLPAHKTGSIFKIGFSSVIVFNCKYSGGSDSLKFHFEGFNSYGENSEYWT